MQPSLLHSSNKLLSLCGFVLKKEFSSVDEIYQVSSSLFVAVFENLFHMRIVDVVRQPKTTEDQVHNAQLAIDGLSMFIEMDLTHITGQAIVDGNENAISNLVHILLRIITITNEEYNQCLTSIQCASEDAEDQNELKRLSRRKGNRVKIQKSGTRQRRHTFTDMLKDNAVMKDSDREGSIPWKNAQHMSLRSQSTDVY